MEHESSFFRILIILAVAVAVYSAITEVYLAVILTSFYLIIAIVFHAYILSTTTPSRPRRLLGITADMIRNKRGQILS